MDTSDWTTFQLFGHCTKYYLSNTNIPNSVPYTITFTKDVGVTFRLTSNWEEIAKVYRTGGSSFVWIMGDECLRLDDWLSHSDGWDPNFPHPRFLHLTINRQGQIFQSLGPGVLLDK